MRARYDAIIIGGGLQGCASALFLARAGWRVAVMEKDYSGRHASGVNSGGVRVLGRDVREIPIAVAARALWSELAALVGDDCGFRAVGNVRVAETDEDFEKLRRRSATVAALGCDHCEALLQRDELQRAVPGIAPHCRGAIVVHSDGYAEPFRTALAFRRAAERSGVRVIESCAAEHAGRSGGIWHVDGGGLELSAPVVINCAGAWGSRVARMLGDDIPLKPDGSMQLVTERVAAFVGPVVGSATRPLSLKQLHNGTVVIGGGQRAPVDLDTNASEVHTRGLAAAARAACALFPALRNARVVRAWSGIEGFTRDRLPVIGPGRDVGVFHAFGFSGHGFQLAPAVGREVAQAVKSGQVTRLIAPFAAARLASDAAALPASA